MAERDRRTKEDILRENLELQKKVKELAPASATPSGNDDTPEKKLKKWEELGAEYYDQVDWSGLCEDGTRMARQLETLLHKPHTVMETIRLTIDLCDFELPSGSDTDETSSYRVTVTDKDGNELVCEVEPDDVENRG